MALNKVNYVNGETVITAENLNAIQDEIIANGNAIGSQATQINGKADASALTAETTAREAAVSAEATARAAADTALTGELNDVKSALTIGTGTVLFYGADASVGPFNTIPSAEQHGNRLTFTSPNGAQTANSGYYVISGGLVRPTNSSALAAIPGNLDLVAGHSYRLRYRLLSGSLTRTDGSGVLRVFVRADNGGNMYIGNQLPPVPGDYSVEFSWGETNGKALIYIQTAVGLLCDDAVIEVTLTDLTAEHEKAEAINGSLLVGEKGLPGLFMRGSRDVTGKFYGTTTSKITTVIPISTASYRQIYSIANGWKVRLTRLGADGSAISNANLTGTLTLEPYAQYHITIMRSTEDETEIADYGTFLGAVERISREEVIMLPGTYIHGSTDVNGKLYTEGYDYRITTTEPFRPERDMSLRIADGYQVNFTRFELDGTTKIAHETAITEFMNLYSGSMYRVTIRKVVEDTSSVADIDTFYRAVSRAVPNEKHLRIMVFGHSYSADCWQYVPFILQNYGITCEIYLYYRGNDSINRLVEEWTETSNYGTDDFGGRHIRRFCHIDTRYEDSWNIGAQDSNGFPGYSAKMILERAAADGPLDLITLQTAPTEVYFTNPSGLASGDPRKGYEPWVRKAIELINASYHQQYLLGWFCAYTRILPYKGNASLGYPAVSGEEFDNRVGALKAAETIYKSEPFGMVVPAAAAVFSARTNQSLASLDVSDIGNLWYSDAVHLQEGIPCYLGNLTVVQSLFNAFFQGLSVLGDTTRITDAWARKHRCLMPSIHGDVKSSDETLYQLAQKCAVIACEHPFDITPIYLPEDTTQLDFYDTHQDRYWADALIDTSLIHNGAVDLTEQAPEA